MTEQLIAQYAPEAKCIEPMKINKIPTGKESKFPEICASGDYFAQIKMDGYWYQFEKTKNHSYLFSRNISEKTGILTEKGANVPHIMGALSVLPAETILVGEVYYPGKTSKAVTPIMGSLPEKAISRQNDSYGLLNYYIHDILWFNGEDLTGKGALERYEILQKIFNDYKFDEKHGGFLQLARIFTENLEGVTYAALSNGEEGVVLKRNKGVYTPGKRPAWETIKIKKKDSCDAVCMAFLDAEKYYTGKLDVKPNYCGKDAKDWPYWAVERVPAGFPEQKEELQKVPLGTIFAIKDDDMVIMPVKKPYYFGWKTSIQVGAYDDEGKLIPIGSVASGLSEEYQAAFAKNPEKYIGRVIKLEGMEKDKKAKTLRHFYFKDFHENKPAKDCLISEIF